MAEGRSAGLAGVLAGGGAAGRGGFDLVLGNPPWETLSPDQREFFGKHYPHIRSLSPAEQERVIAELLASPSMAEAWRDNCRDLFALVHFLKQSGRFTLYAKGNLGKGDFNVYRMFVELALRLTRPGGFAAQIVPGGLYAGANASAIRNFLLDECELTHLFGLSNTRRGWFEGVDMDRFAAYTARRGGRTDKFVAHFGLASPADLAEPGVALDAAQVRIQEPLTYVISDVRNDADLSTARKMYARHPAFGDLEAGPPIRQYQAEIHMGSNSDLFTNDINGLPVYEGRMIDAFDHRAKTYVSGHGNSSVWTERTFGDPGKAILPQWRIMRSRIPGKLADRPDRFRIGFGDVANPRNERSFVATLIPPGVLCGHTVPTILFPRDYDWAFLPWLAVANSYVMDGLARSKLSSPHMTYSLMDSLPFPRFTIDDPVLRRIAPIVLSLVCTAPEMTPYWNAMAVYGFCTAVPDGTVPGDALVDEGTRAIARAELDAIVARDVFGLSRVEVEAILETFPVVKKRDLAKYGEFRTKRVILEIYDEMAEATRTGVAYRTRLVPGAADSGVAHSLQAL